ncbi:hypothetical protein ECANGB1_2305 [Enterospora canceri]|uniref:CCHC-type domain-containing protein n=1 Tax=Enterospora canceri TaxID=1081671 RepID=A0A1Y1S4T0_9MICR|nr:hypothetical protein ECANGB1_2305 [Enterospora canceri]
MPRVRIKHPDPNGAAKIHLLRILSEHLIYATKIIPVNDGFIVLTGTDEEIDKIFNTNLQRSLNDQNFNPIVPPELRAKRTIVIFNVDEYIYNQPTKEIEDELIGENSWLQDGIESIFKVPRTKIMKICLNQTAAAKKATESGILAFHMSIPAHNIKIEEFIPILTCMRCYQLESHPTNKCPRTKEHKVCSECANEGHTWKDCLSLEKKCLNCNGQHRTLANKCPKRKEIKEKKRNENKGKKNLTYSQATATTTTNPINPLINTSDCFNKDTATKIMACMMHAHIQNIARPGTYNDEINKVFKLNNLPSIILPENPPSADIFSMTTTIPQDNTAEETPLAATGATAKQTKTQETQNTINEDVQDSPPTPTQIKGSQLGLQIITRKSEGWPKHELNVQHIKFGIDTGLYKWRYTCAAYEEQELYIYITNNEVDLVNCFCITDDSQFKKIRNGLVQERTPPPNKHRYRHSSK